MKFFSKCLQGFVDNSTARPKCRTANKMRRCSGFSCLSTLWSLRVNCLVFWLLAMNCQQLLAQAQDISDSMFARSICHVDVGSKWSGTQDYTVQFPSQIKVAPHAKIGTVIATTDVEVIHTNVDVTGNCDGINGIMMVFLTTRGQLVSQQIYSTNIPGVGYRVETYLGGIYFSGKEGSHAFLDYGKNRKLGSGKKDWIVIELIKTGPIQSGVLENGEYARMQIKDEKGNITLYRIHFASGSTII